MIRVFRSMAILTLLYCGSASAQALTIPELKDIARFSTERIDTLMKGRNFHLLQKETDSVSNLVYFTNLEKTPEGATWVRSLTYIDAGVKNMKSRLVRYRTYRKKEYQDMMAWLLKNNFHTASRTEFDGGAETTYTNGTETLLFKVSKQKLPSGTMVLSYEVEIGN